ncbi:MAG TPA: protease modulator HflK, partial [Candidatus Tectomicrobia bacterium]
MSERDFPPRGRQPASELEDMLAQVQQYWQRFRGAPIIGLVAVVVVLIFLWSSWFTVQPEETGVVQRFGKIVRTAAPGLHF